MHSSNFMHVIPESMQVEPGHIINVIESGCDISKLSPEWKQKAIATIKKMQKDLTFANFELAKVKSK